MRPNYPPEPTSTSVIDRAYACSDPVKEKEIPKPTEARDEREHSNRGLQSRQDSDKKITDES